MFRHFVLRHPVEQASIDHGFLQSGQHSIVHRDCFSMYVCSFVYSMNNNHGNCVSSQDNVILVRLLIEDVLAFVIKNACLLFRMV